MVLLASNQRPRWFTAVSLILLIWNVIGIAAFLIQWNVAHHALDSVSPAEQQMWRAMPGWAWAAYAIAVCTGTLGAIGLVMRKSWSILVLATSLLAVLIQFFSAFVLQEGLATLGPGAALFPLFIIGVGVFQLVLAGRGRKAGWLG